MNKTKVSISFKNIAAIRERKPAPAPPLSAVLSLPPKMGQHGMMTAPSTEEQRKIMLKMKLKQRIADKEHGMAMVGNCVASIPLDDGGYRTCGAIVSPIEETQSTVHGATDLMLDCMQIDCQEPVQVLAPLETPYLNDLCSMKNSANIQKTSTPAMRASQTPQLHGNQELGGQPLEEPQRISPPIPTLSASQYEHMHPFFTPFSAGGCQMLFMPVHMPSPTCCLLSLVSETTATPGSTQSSNTPPVKMHPQAFGEGEASRMASLGSRFHPTLQSQLSMRTLIDSLNFDKNAQGETKGPSPVMGILVPVNSTAGASNESGDSSAIVASPSAIQTTTNTSAHMPISVVFSANMYHTYLEQRNIMTCLQETNESAAEPPLLERRKSLSWMLDMALPMSDDAETSKGQAAEEVTSSPEQEVQRQQKLFIQVPTHHLQHMYNFKSQGAPPVPAPQQEATPAGSASSSTFTTGPPGLGITASPDTFKSLNPTSPFPLQHGFNLYLQAGEDNSMMYGGVFAPFQSAPGVMFAGDDIGGMGHIWVPVTQVQGVAGVTANVWI
ncbi:hypothetical protein BC830DRAFT_1165082 [Chytriomyces sp. MP71]|nr:hypothetical protein BC830DRAFT_1165082 [Chytriomyces sp. MP71]